ncbi:MAG TPA: hemolysin family protein, partial [Dehalococcoidia bacterium]|nr:hemolysin family protein [Dehalococcoidia bacterium]
PEKARKVERFASNPGKLLSTVLTGNNLANTAAAALGTALAASFLSANTAVIAATIGVTIILLVFAEAIPKTIATRHSIGLAILMSGPLRIVEFILLPPIWVLERVVQAVTRLFGVRDSSLFSREEIIALVDIGKEAGAVAPLQAEMLGNVFRVEDRQLKEVMTPRTEIIGVKQGSTLEEFFQIYAQHAHTRFPIYEDNIDHIVGIVSVKDVMQNMARQDLYSGDDVTRLATPPIFLPETRMLGEHLRHIQTTGEQMIILVDEYGGVAGLVTLKEMVEEIVGPMSEPGEEDEEYLAIDQDTYQVDGSLDIDEANEELGLGIPEGDYETVAGFIMTRLGVIPKAGDQLVHNEFALEVTEMRGVKIEKILVTRLVRPEEVVT